MQDLTQIQLIAIAILPIMLAITVHEASHALVADKLGDRTARALGRVTLNPFKHIDPLGTIILPIVMFLTTGFMFGWAKPVPVNWRNLGNIRRDTAIVAAAGPFANLLMMLLWPLLFILVRQFAGNSEFVMQPLYHMMVFGIQINAVLMVLNLLPILPLDGGRIVNSLLPAKMSYEYSKTERWGFLILIVLLVSGLLGQILGPVVQILMQMTAGFLGIFA